MQLRQSRLLCQVSILIFETFLTLTMLRIFQIDLCHAKYFKWTYLSLNLDKIIHCDFREIFNIFIDLQANSADPDKMTQLR
jgi:hypothetical protein